MNFNLPKKREYIYNIKRDDGSVYRTNIILVGKTITLMRRGFSPLILIVGKQRIGKSFVGVWLANQIIKFFHKEDRFDIVKNTFYDPIKIISRMSELNKSVLMTDEAGALLNKSEWWQKTTIALDKIVQTQGVLNNAYIFISPFGSDIAKTFRKHFDFVVKVRKRGVIVVKEVPKKYDDLTGKVFKPYMVEQVIVPKNAITTEMWNIYEKHSFEQKEQMREDLGALKQLDNSVINKAFKMI